MDLNGRSWQILLQNPKGEPQAQQWNQARGCDESKLRCDTFRRLNVARSGPQNTFATVSAHLVAKGIKNDVVREFWIREYEHYSFGYRADGAGSIQNKVGALLADPTLHRIFTNPKEDIRIRKIMDQGGILLVNLAKGRIGEDSSNLLGALLVTTISLAAFSRADVPEGERRDFILYIDEFQNFTTLSLANMASELRKYGVGLVLAHQYLPRNQPCGHWRGKLRILRERPNTLKDQRKIRLGAMLCIRPQRSSATNPHSNPWNRSQKQPASSAANPRASSARG